MAKSLKRVGFFVPGWPPQHYPNGIVSYVANLRTELDKRGITSSILALETQGSIAPDIIDLSKISKFDSWIYRLLRKVTGRVREDAIDLVQFGRTVAAGALELYRREPFDLFEIEESFGLAEYVREKLPVPVVLRLHGPWFINGRALGGSSPSTGFFEKRNQAEGKAIRKALAVSSPSLDTLTRVRKEFSCPLSSARVIPNLGPPLTKDQQWLLSESDPNLILFVGRFDRHKGGDLILRAFVELATDFPNAYLVFVGPDRGYVDDDDRKWTFAEYKDQLTDDPKIQARIDFRGTLATSEIQELRKKARVTVVASRDEIFGMTVLESLAYGSPLIASDVGGIPELVTHEKNGLLFPPNRPGELKRQLAELLGNSQRCLELSEGAKRDYEARLSPSILAEQTLRFYQELLL